MERAKAIHTILVEMTTGMLVLATIAAVLLVGIVFFGSDRHRRFRDGLDAVALFGAGIGAPMILLAILSGFRQWPLAAFFHGAIVQNKILAAFTALFFWAGFLFLRLLAGKQLWERRGPSLYALVLALGGFVYLVFTASIGGALARKPSGFEEIVRIFVETRATFVLPLAANVLLIVAGIGLPLLAFLWSRKRSV